jgi:hypothetical protein
VHMTTGDRKCLRGKERRLKRCRDVYYCEARNWQLDNYETDTDNTCRGAAGNALREQSERGIVIRSRACRLVFPVTGRCMLEVV